ncbi:MAG: protein kinase [Verrucomicrobia bacterium]|nr:protein kinase [Verrucomicrobiota bacterium]MBT7068346.1 protein kinase [Verrucomicrobiota bacterium]MBT7700849.1 protein kinase [Verrucomicrobiota bacterium]
MSEFEIEGFEILERLGSGGMATVWKARQLSLDRIVAIKVLSSDLSKDPEDIERFKSEAQSEAKLKHPGIVQVYDANVESGTCYIVQEFVDGYTVGDWVRRKSILSEEDSLLVAGYVADALAYAWETAGIIHCDIKPDNILIDADGSPKVTDLGLARTISAMGVENVTDEVMGTPAYMSPEQIQGASDIDCRTDIYSLGAMLYQLVTGRMLFQGETDDDIMEQQLSGHVDAPAKVNEKLSPAVCGLIEKMLAKEREHRYVDWHAVRADISRAKRHLPPTAPVTSPNLSTARHTPMPKVVKVPHGGAHVVQRSMRAQHGSVVPLLATLFAGAVGVIAGIWVYGKLMDAVAPTVALEPLVRKVVVTQGRTRAQRLFEEAQAWAASHPNAFVEAEQRYRRVRMVGPHTEYDLMARNAIRDLHAARYDGIRKIMAALDERATPMRERGELLAAAAVYVGYAGLLADDTREEREARAAELRRLHEANEQRQRMAVVESRQQVERVLDDVVAAILDGGLAAGQAVLRDAPLVADPDKAAALVALGSLLEQAANSDGRIMDSFAAQVGQTINVALKSGRKPLKIMGVVEGRVHARVVTSVKSASVELTFRAQDLVGSERLARMGDDSDPDVALAKGLMAWRAGSMEYAREFFSRTDPLLVSRLAAAVGDKASADGEVQAEAAMVQLLRALSMPINGDYSKEMALIYLRALRVASADADRIELLVARYRQLHGKTEFGVANAIVLDTILATASKAASVERHFETGVEGTGGLTREALLAALQKANPELDDFDVTTDVSADGAIIGLAIATDAVEDLRALGACKDLVSLSLACPRVSDLAGIADLPIQTLEITASGVSELGALRRMPLTKLTIESSPVRDLSPLRGKPLTLLSIAGTKISELRTLTGMPLVSLDVSNTSVKWLDALKGMPLKSLDVSDCTVSSLTALRALPLTHLNISGTAVKDLTFLNGSQIVKLVAARTAIATLSGLRGSKVRSLYLSQTRLRSLDGVDGVELERLDISQTRVTDLAPLRGLPLRWLSIDSAPVRDLKPLRSLPLEHLACSNLATTDYEALRGMRLTSINIGNLRAVRAILLTMPDLKKINGLPIPGRGGVVPGAAVRPGQVAKPDASSPRRP